MEMKICREKERTERRSEREKRREKEMGYGMGIYIASTRRVDTGNGGKSKRDKIGWVFGQFGFGAALE
ncbi:hypothetical protein VNO77_02918 [Canavalia gladiata]|uniref:Uncharacterized protein n=1 Tax=Canavalia gladiata TaxID=3824 RepID=A0AAN9MUL6_CANGL